MNFAMAFSFATYVYVWCSTSNPNPHFLMMFIMASLKLTRSTTWFVCLNILKHAKKIALNIYLIIMRTYIMRCVKKYAKRIGHIKDRSNPKAFK
jgi:hypothetical protein